MGSRPRRKPPTQPASLSLQLPQTLRRSPPTARRRTMYRAPHHNPPILKLFRGGTNAIKSRVETGLGRENTHLSTLNEEPERHGARATGPAHAGLPPHLLGI
ncbi:hypothetical protein NDU88_003944 [Pleurodeles waltl]|uniref:Uncharacterized protein n=1 Tax=Pleurodeles waltl TaxID=8319 RepID=A0AAV7QDG3_PLEWA|nr:hypothetical protein NDU88_003944 [Pleurodeles waltl]